jgi:hypothetical protein
MQTATLLRWSFLAGLNPLKLSAAVYAWIELLYARRRSLIAYFGKACISALPLWKLARLALHGM